MTAQATPSSSRRTSLLLGALLAALLMTSTACAANPADDVPSATMSDPIDNVNAPAESMAQPQDEDGVDEAHGGTMGEEDAAEAAEDDGAMEGDVEADMGQPMSGEVIDLSGEISFTGSKVTGSHTCVFQEWTGGIAPGAGTADTATLSFAVEAASLFCDADSRNSFTERFETHMRSDEFFNAEAYPQATFVSSNIVEGGEGDATHTITGDLTIAGISHEITFPAVVTVDDASVAGTATFSVDRQRWNMAYEGKPDDLVRDEVVIAIDLAGQR